jgi:hypothetical protein
MVGRAKSGSNAKRYDSVCSGDILYICNAKTSHSSICNSKQYQKFYFYLFCLVDILSAKAKRLFSIALMTRMDICMTMILVTGFDCKYHGGHRFRRDEWINITCTREPLQGSKSLISAWMDGEYTSHIDLAHAG